MKKKNNLRLDMLIVALLYPQIYVVQSRVYSP